MGIDKDYLDFANNYNLHMLLCSYQTSTDPNYKSLGSFTSAFSRIIIMESGTLYYFVDTKEFALTPGHVYFIPSGLKLKYRADGPFTKLNFHITLDGDYGHSFFSNLRQPASIPVSQEETAVLAELIKDNSLESTLLLKTKLHIIFLNMFPEIKKSMYSHYSPMVKTAIDYMWQACSIKCTSKILSRDLHVSENTLAKKFREEVGISLGKYNDIQVFNEAEKMLLNSDWSMRQISDMLGFCDQFYFSRRFKQIKGMLPSEFRKLHRDAEPRE